MIVEHGCVKFDILCLFHNRWGFHVPISHTFVIQNGVTKLPTDFQPDHLIKVQPITVDNFDDVMGFDRTLSPYDRTHIMKVFFFSPHTQVVMCAVENNTVKGYIMIRDGRKGVRVSAFYAETPAIAKQLLYDAVNAIGAGSFMDCGFWTGNPACGPLYKMFGLDNHNADQDGEGFCTKQTVHIPWHMVYGFIEKGTTLF